MTALATAPPVIAATILCLALALLVVIAKAMFATTDEPARRLCAILAALGRQRPGAEGWRALLTDPSPGTSGSLMLPPASLTPGRTGAASIGAGRMEPLIPGEDPASIGGYELIARLGQGGFGRVYLGLSPAGRPVAVKVLHRELADDQEFLHRFRQEVATARQVSGMYTAPVVAAGVDDRPPWFATTFVCGPSLQQLVAAHGPLPEAVLWRLHAGLVEALNEINRCGIIHRDLKPANVLLTLAGPCIIDFGISKTADGPALTSKGAVLGTPGFMSPEHLGCGPVGPATDVFSLGCLLAFAATGVPPFGNEASESAYHRIVHGAPALNGIPPRLRALVEACLAKDPEARPTLADLSRIDRDGPGGVSRVSPASFWPLPVSRLIRDYQDDLDRAIAESVPVAQKGATSSPITP